MEKQRGRPLKKKPEVEAVKASVVPEWVDPIRVIEDEGEGSAIPAEQVPVIEPKRPRLNLMKKTVTEAVRGGRFLPVLAWAESRNKSRGDVSAKVAAASVSEHLKEINDSIDAAASRMFGEEMTAGKGIAKMLATRALTGDLGAIREYMNRTEGKVPNRTINSSTTSVVKGNATDFATLLEKIDNNK